MESWTLTTQSHQPIGLDIGHHSIKMIQLVMNGERIKVLAADKVRIDSGIDGDAAERKSFIISAVKQMLANGKFRGKDVVTCLPNDSLRITSLRLAEAADDEIEQNLRKEAAQRFGLDPDKDSVDYMLAGSVQQEDEVKNEWILFAADSETIKNHIEMLEQIHLNPVAIDTVPCALFRSFERLLRRQADKERTVVFVDVGSRFTTVVFGRGEEINFVKQIPVGGEKFNKEIAAKLGIGLNDAEMLRNMLRMEKPAPAGDVPIGGEKSLANPVRPEGLNGADDQNQPVAVPVVAGSGELDASTRQAVVDTVGAIAEELAREISLCFRYYTVTFRGRHVDRVIFAGGEAYENILLNVLRRQLAVDVEVAQPLRGFDMTNVNFDGNRQSSLCEWAVAVGLGLKGWKPAGIGSHKSKL